MIQYPRPQSPTQQMVEIAVRYANPGVNLRDHALCRLVLIASEMTYDDLQELNRRLQAERAGS